MENKFWSLPCGNWNEEIKEINFINLLDNEIEILINFISLVLDQEVEEILDKMFK